MEAKFTKGPWVKDHRNESLKGCEGYDVVVWGCGLSHGSKNVERVANAHLIASAPDGFALGELIIKMCDHYEGLSPTEVGILYEAAKEFIKKCKGE